MTAGDIIINAVIRADAVERAERAPCGTWIFVWRANAAEQIEAALRESGHELAPIPPDLRPPTSDL